MMLDEIIDQEQKEQIALTILRYYEYHNCLKYNSANNTFSVLGLESRTEYMIVADALKALGAKDFTYEKGKVVIEDSDGGRIVAEKAKSLELKFHGDSNVHKSRSP